MGLAHHPRNENLVKDDARVAISLPLVTNSYRIFTTGALADQGTNLEHSLMIH